MKRMTQQEIEEFKRRLPRLQSQVIKVDEAREQGVDKMVLGITGVEKWREQIKEMDTPSTVEEFRDLMEKMLLGGVAFGTLLGEAMFDPMQIREDEMVQG